MLFFVIVSVAGMLASCNGNGKTAEAGSEEGAATGTLAGHEWVDLGLSVNWATCNIGASKPEEYGNYYAWGETQAKDKDDYSWETYKYCKG